MADAMKLVPVEPTREMIEAAYEAHYGKRRARRSGGAVGISMAVDGADYDGLMAFRRMWKGALAASPPAREEAPAELMDAGLEAWLTARDLMPHGSWEWPSIVAMLDHHEDALTIPKAPAKGAGEIDDAVTEIAVSTIRWAMGRGDDLKDYKEPLEHVLEAALRNRTSEPEAGEGFAFWTENLIDIVEGIGSIPHGTWRDEKGKRLKDTTAWAAFYVAARRTHPASATADKLRMAVEGLGLAQDYIKVLIGDPRQHPDGPSESDGEACQVLDLLDRHIAALNEQPQ